LIINQVIAAFRIGLASAPPDPQLPIYCVFGNNKAYDGLAFAQVRAGAMQFKGMISEKIPEIHDPGMVNINNFDNIDEINDWSTLTTHWKTTLENLSESFYQGRADADPLDSACDYCDLQSLCRVNECQS